VLKQNGEITATACRLDELKLLGVHNIENVMAAFAISYYMGVPVDVIHRVITEFQAVEHRIEYVDTIDGVDYYNDSKGTNPDAAIKGIQAMVKPTILIGGGYDKGVAFDEWIESFDGKVRYLVLLGVTAETIADTAKRHGFTDIIMVDSLQEAVDVSAQKAQAGDAVLLSPACASWDMFQSYEQRGELFKEYVKALK
jgi:UDP-N-acetylmuramoylalanine--D-glutamate ligase